jgi:hypothetical protein
MNRTMSASAPTSHRWSVTEELDEVHEQPHDGDDGEVHHEKQSSSDRVERVVVD